MNDQVDSKTLNENRVLDVVRAQLMLDGTREIPTVDASSTLESLGLDSLDQVEIVLGLEDEFCIVIDDEEAEKFTSVKAIFDHIAARDDLA